MNVSPTTKDVSRAVARLDEHAGIGMRDTVREDGLDYTGDELVQRVAEALAFTTGHVVRLSRVSRRDAALMLAAHGATPFTIEEHAYQVAARMRALSDREGRISATV